MLEWFYVQPIIQQRMTGARWVSCEASSQFHDERHLLAAVKGVEDLDDARVLEVVHDLHLALHVPFVVLARRGHELGRQLPARLLVRAPVHNAELTPDGKRQQISTETTPKTLGPVGSYTLSAYLFEVMCTYIHPC